MSERQVNPYNPLERPTFLPGDKVRDKRDDSKTIWRIKGRVAYYDTELMTLSEVGNDSNTRSCRADGLIPWLEMVAMSVPHKITHIEDGKDG